jgi:hypothetical protein
MQIEHDTDKIILGDSLQILKQIDAESVDLITVITVCDFLIFAIPVLI